MMKTYEYINVHDHGAGPQEGVFTVENIMVHENHYPVEIDGLAYSCGVHPWNIEEGNINELVNKVREYALLPNVIALGEAGYDRIRGTGMELQEKAFMAQAEVSEEMKMPLDRLFLETDGFDIGIEPVYRVVAEHLGIELEVLRKSIYHNFYNVFQKSSLA